MEQLRKQYIDDLEEDFQSPDNSHKIDMTNIINNAHTLGELFDILENVSEIQGTKETISSEDLISQIEAVQNKQANLETITRSLGLRDKVFSLLEGNVLSSEIQERKNLEQISSVTSIEELKNICNQIDSIETSSGDSITGEDLVLIIDKIEHRLLPLEALTRTAGLRDKVYELLGKTIISQEAEEREQLEQARTALYENKSEQEPNVLEKSEQEYEDLRAQYQEAYEEYRNLIAQQPTGLKKLFSFFKNKKYMEEKEKQVNSLKQQLQEKEAEYLDMKEKIVPFHE